MNYPCNFYRVECASELAHAQANRRSLLDVLNPLVSEVVLTDYYVTHEMRRVNRTAYVHVCSKQVADAVVAACQAQPLTRYTTIETDAHRKYGELGTSDFEYHYQNNNSKILFVLYFKSGLCGLMLK